MTQHRADADAQQHSAEHNGEKLRARDGRDELKQLEKAGKRRHCKHRPREKPLSQYPEAHEEKRNVYDYDQNAQAHAREVVYHHAHARHTAVEYRVGNKKALDGKRSAARADDYHADRQQMLLDKMLHFILYAQSPSTMR